MVTVERLNCVAGVAAELSAVFVRHSGGSGILRAVPHTANACSAARLPLLCDLHCRMSALQRDKIYERQENML